MALESPDFADFYRSAHPGLVAEFYAHTGDFAGPAQASAWLAALREQVEECGVAPSSAPVGDEGYRIEADQVPERSGRLFHLVSAVFYRQGPVVAVHSRQRFREERDTGETAGILQDLEEDARAFSQRLCARGFGC